ncbi:hypothetical protein CANTEDRAFT_104939 [Yamadazyma tenuis ATCC 10573]|uniref:DUF202 domain-containing protein n=1 Tax=Candida tenuis (strain ATCC 10573 / BCRC 21748 / CBS 615 / JCM 9827 / NBRC 10315 / NRRL Y-1498 / VKM Y-70) TaxID=590646 RepID=G3B443_CANTC|nr:uncharacterized protein CANTEDRAFT_104939 [Yamadazyma tenuis ATCC 10573]EGV63770.1 hypothetical protein CANTEDRAFT_104939 [Yamadazyma tenuis ATCC 10573]
MYKIIHKGGCPQLCHSPRTIFAPFFKSFHKTMILKIKTSEPRDALQSERTCLSFIRFSTTLFITSFGILLNFKLDSSSSAPLRQDFLSSYYSKVLSYMLIALSGLFLVLSGITYFVTMKRYKLGKIENFGFNNVYHSVLVFVLILVLFVVNIALLVSSYKTD